MRNNALEQVRATVLLCLEGSLATAGFIPAAIPDEFDLRTEGVIDSLGFVQLIADMESRLGVAIDLSDIDPEVLTTLGPLVRHISRQLPIA